MPWPLADKDAAASGKPVLVMGTSPDYPPYEFYSLTAAMTQYAGIDVEVAKYIAESMGMELQIEAMNFDNLVTSLSNGDFDMVLAACEYTDERALACDFSDPYYTDLPPGHSGEGVPTPTSTRPSTTSTRPASSSVPRRTPPRPWPRRICSPMPPTAWCSSLWFPRW